MSAIRKLIEAVNRNEAVTATYFATLAEAELEELEGRGVVVPLHQYENACKQREEAFARARAAEAKLAERDRADAELMRELEHQRGGGTRERMLAQLERWAAATGGGK